MTANEIIKQIEDLTPGEQDEVIRYLKKLEGKRRLSGGQLAAMAEELAGCDDPAVENALREKLVEGFYGADKDA